MGQGPDPATAHSPEQFVELMRQLRRWADLSYRQLERNANDADGVLPRATIAAALSRDELPRAELLAAYVRACGGDDEAVTAWLNARRRLSIPGTTAPPPAPADKDAQRTTADKHDDAQQKTVRAPVESAADEQTPGAGPASEPTSREATAPAGDTTTRPANTPSKRRRRGQVVAITACTVAGILALVALWPSGDGSDDHAGSTPPSAQPHDPTIASTTSRQSSSPASKQPPPPASERRTDEAGPAVSPAEQEKETPAPRPSHSAEPGPTQLPAAGWTLMHPAASASLCLTEGRERNGRTDREIAVQHLCASAPLPRVYLEKLSGPTYRIQWHNPDPGKGIGCLAVDGSSAAPGALIAPRDCADSNSQKFRLEASGSGFRLRPVHSGLCVGFLPPLTDGAEAMQTTCTTDSSQAFTFTRA
ncbi:RICIN domain-containing protein [Streptomyces sp. YS-3]|uniref:RICIN domain-containing protein n=1 Tax=Streptomyces sp. YS-3 TaxID=3381352 RepID=UPI0038628E0F